MLHGLTILRLDADAIITRLIFIIFDESNPKRFHLGGTDLSIAPVVVADGFRVSSARRCFVESASGPRLPGDDPLVVAKESANLDSTKARDTVRGPYIKDPPTPAARFLQPDIWTTMHHVDGKLRLAFEAFGYP